MAKKEDAVRDLPLGGSCWSGAAWFVFTTRSTLRALSPEPVQAVSVTVYCDDGSKPVILLFVPAPAGTLPAPPTSAGAHSFSLFRRGVDRQLTLDHTVVYHPVCVVTEKEISAKSLFRFL